MKLSISFNAFDGVELLQEAINRVRPVAEHISVIYQNQSNFGELDYTGEDIINTCSGIDSKLCFTPSSLGGHHNEITKRNLGLNLARISGCEIFMSCDVDEFYNTEQLQKALELFIAGGHDASACQMQTYYKTIEWCIDPPEDYFVPLFYRTNIGEFTLSAPFPVNADPTRRIQSSNFLMFRRDQIQMHHMSYVRNDIRKKLRNSSASLNFQNRIEQIASYHDNWKEGDKALLAGREERWYSTRKVNSI